MPLPPSSIYETWLHGVEIIPSHNLLSVSLQTFGETMAFSQTARIGACVFCLGFISFLLAIFAETSKPPFGTPIQAKDAVICKFPDDPSILLGTLSVVTLVLAAIAGHVAVYFPYKGKSVPRNALFRSATLSTFFVLAEVLTVLALLMLLWTTISESLHRSRNVHRDLTTQCPTAKTGLFGGGAFLALDAALFWLVCQMLTLNARSDYLDEDDTKGEYIDVCTTEFDVAETHLPTA